MTLTVGGIGIILATVVPLIARAIFVFPLPLDASWLYYFWQPFFEQVSGAILVVAFIVLAVGIRPESGIVGKSIIGRISLILFPLTRFAETLIGPVTVSNPGPDRTAIALMEVETWTTLALNLVALVVASIVVLRAGVIHGVARWALVPLAVTSIVSLLLSLVPNLVAGQLSFWGYSLTLVFQLLVGVAYVLHRQTAGLKWHQLATEAA